MYVNQMITGLGGFLTLLKNASEEKQRNFFRAFFAVHSSLPNPQAQAQAQAVTALNTQVLEILVVNNDQVNNDQVINYQAKNTTQALLDLAKLLNSDTANLITLGDVGALNCVASSKPMGREDLSKLVSNFSLTPQQQALQSFTKIIDDLIECKFVIQDGLMTAREVVNSALAPTPAQAQHSCAAASAEPAPAQHSCAAASAEPTTPRTNNNEARSSTTPRTNNNEARSSTTPPPAPSRPSSVELPTLPQAMRQALAELRQQRLSPFPFSLFARPLDDRNKDKGI